MDNVLSKLRKSRLSAVERELSIMRTRRSRQDHLVEDHTNNCSVSNVVDGEGETGGPPLAGSRLGCCYTDNTTSGGYEQFEDNPKTTNSTTTNSTNKNSIDIPPENQRDAQPHIIKELYTFFLRRSWKKKLFTILAISSLIPVILDVFVLQTNHITNFINNFLDWMAEYPLEGVWAYVCIITVSSLIFVPPSILIFGAGFTFSSIWGGWTGIMIALVASYLGSVIGGFIGFWRARYMTRDLIEVLMRRYPIIKAVDVAIVKNSLRVMILMRLNCLIPFGVLNYVFGITAVDWAVFTMAMVGILPWHLLLICLGASSATVYDKSGEITLMQIILMSTGFAFGIIGLVITWKFAKKELQKVRDISCDIILIIICLTS